MYMCNPQFCRQLPNPTQYIFRNVRTLNQFMWSILQRGLIDARVLNVATAYTHEHYPSVTRTAGTSCTSSRLVYCKDLTHFRTFLKWSKY